MFAITHAEELSEYITAGFFIFILMIVILIVYHLLKKDLRLIFLFWKNYPSKPDNECYYQIEGMISPTKGMLQAPFTGEDCCYYSYHTDLKHRRSIEKIRTGASIEFLKIKNHLGDFYICPLGANIIAEEKSIKNKKLSIYINNKKLSDQYSHKDNKNLKSNLYNHYQTIIAPNEKVTVIGPIFKINRREKNIFNRKSLPTYVMVDEEYEYNLNLHVNKTYKNTESLEQIYLDNLNALWNELMDDPYLNENSYFISVIGATARYPLIISSVPNIYRRYFRRVYWEIVGLLSFYVVLMFFVLAVI